MEIIDVTATTVDVPLVDLEERLGIGPYVTNHGQVNSMERVLVRVDTDEGMSGWGEMRTFLSPAATESILEDGIAPLIKGQSPFETERLRRQVFIEYTNVELFFAAVETACWDIVGKALGKPVFELLGGASAPQQTTAMNADAANAKSETDRDIEFAFCLGILPPAESRTKAREALDSGFSVLKTKAGRDWQQDIARIEAMHDEVNGELEFRLDPNQGWSLDQAVRIGAALEDSGIYLQYMEQPIRVNSHDSLSTLRQRLRQPIAPNEDTYIPNNIRSLIETGSMDVAVLDLTPAGGIGGLRQQAAIVEDAGIPYTHHCAFDLGIRTAAILHAVHGLPGFSLPPDTTYYAWEDDIIEEPFQVTDGCMTVPDDPGLGIDIDLDVVEEYQV
ncbi:mandelate racemase/muconate lactonizing enzyme family protein [Halobacterium sp. KA-6]|uniref:mandelate racemase/muconate lactonizing enzyme family protein n=1 Tax=Halobacterium sp. KA-6 TaxID=2896368 RepID=UPI001E5DF183|nr:mandelate racemase/muconate lactonizing enzyme family protein [Halobacterium sp. KA-6]MCD2204063.1 mandelate racemase/muconate lactonizing enzyme family protein [Halobacterium sp. KA-6]